jgi:hypothetical protein
MSSLLISVRPQFQQLSQSKYIQVYNFIVIVGSLSTSLALMELEQIEIFNEVLDENIGEIRLDDDSLFDSDYSG